MNNQQIPPALDDMYKVGLGEKLSYGMGDMACNFIFTTIGTFLMFFYTDVFGISAIAAGTIFLLARIWDAINDPIMGYIVDRTHTKWGKFRPYLLWGAAPFALVAILCFSTPNLNPMGKIIYAAATYVAVGMVYTMVNVPYLAMTSAITRDPKSRMSLNAYRAILAMIGAIIVTSGVPYMAAALGDGGSNMAKGYQLTMVIFGIIGMFLLLISFAKTKERVQVPRMQARVNASDIFQNLRKNKPMLILCISFFIGFSILSISGATAIYFFQYNLKMPGMFGLFNLMGLIPYLLGFALTPKLTQIFSKKSVMIFGFIISMVTPIGLYLLPTNNIIPFFIVKIIGSFGEALPLGLLWGMVPDVVEYGHWRTGKRTEGLVYATAGFFFKFGTALGGIVPGLILGIYGYIPNQPQTSSGLMGIKMCVSVVPIVISILGVIMMSFYNLTDKRLNEIIDDLRNDRTYADYNKEDMGQVV